MALYFTRSQRRLGAFATAVALGCVGIGAGIAASKAAEPSIVYSKTIEPPPTTSSSDTPGEILAAVVGRNAFSRVEKAQLGSAPEDYLADGYTGTWVYFTVRTSDADGPRALRGVWEATLAAGAFRDEMFAAGLTVPEGYGVLTSQPGEEARPLMAWAFADVILGQQFTPAQDGPAIESRARDTLRAAGFEPESVAASAPKDLALSVIARASSVDQLESREAIESLVRDVFGSVEAYEGVYFEIQGDDGQPLFVLARSFRVGDGASYYAPSLGIPPLRGVPPVVQSASER